MTDEYVEATPTEDYGTPIPPIEEEKGGGSKIWIILIVVLLVLCCCCVVVAALMYFVVGDIILETLELYTLAPMLLL